MSVRRPADPPIAAAVLAAAAFAPGAGPAAAADALPPGPAAWRAGGAYLHYGPHRVFFRRGGADPAGGAAGDKPTLLALHGFPTSSYDFHRVWPALTARFDVIAVDFLGLGFSDKPKRHRYSVFEQADIVECLLRTLGVREVHILAHDLGGTVAQELLARARDRRRAACGPAGPGPRAGVVYRSAVFLNGGLFIDAENLNCGHRLFESPAGDALEPLVCRAAFEKIAEEELIGPAAQRCAIRLGEFWAILKSGGGKFVLHDVIQYLGERRRYEDRWSGALAAAPGPLAFVYGPADAISGDDIARRFARVAPSVRITPLPGLSHYPHMEDPGRVLAAFFAFHDRAAGPAPGAVPGAAPPPAPAPAPAG